MNTKTQIRKEQIRNYEGMVNDVIRNDGLNSPQLLANLNGSRGNIQQQIDGLHPLNRVRQEQYVDGTLQGTIIFTHPASTESSVCAYLNGLQLNSNEFTCTRSEMTYTSTEIPLEDGDILSVTYDTYEPVNEQ